MPKLFECSFTFTEDDPLQFLEIAVVDEGAGPFWVLKTEKWAVDDLKELASLLQRVVDLTHREMR